MSTELFVLPEQLKQAVMGSDMDVVCSLVADMQEYGIFRLPYDKIDVRFVNNGFTTMQIKNLCVIGPVIDPHSMFTRGVKTPPFTLGEVEIDGRAVLLTGPNKGERILRGDADERIAQGYGCADVAAIVLIIALATSNIDKKTVANKRARLGIGKAANKQYSQITYLNLPMTATASGTRHGSDERASVRMHLRRGHSRRQHFGSGNAQIKRIWIAPTFVNADDNYVPREKYQAA